jgi:general secretion pathway protein G
MDQSSRSQSPPRTSAAAIWSLVLGILSCILLGFLAGIPAIICGHIARRKARLSPHSYGGGGLAVAGLVLGYVGTVVSALLLTILFLSAVYNVRASTYQACLSRTQVDLLMISTQLNLYESLSGKYPTTEQGLRALVERPTTGPVPDRWYQLFRELPKDPWGHTYFYRCPAGITYDLFSAGPDGVPDTADDIRKW